MLGAGPWCGGSCSLGSRELGRSKMWCSRSLWDNPFGRDELAQGDFYSISEFPERPQIPDPGRRLKLLPKKVVAIALKFLGRR